MLDKNDYAVFTFSLVNLCKKKWFEKQSFKNTILEELEKHYPSVDTEVHRFYRLRFIDKKIQVLVVLVETSLLESYEIEKKSLRIVFEKKKICLLKGRTEKIIAKLALFSLLFLFIMTIFFVGFRKLHEIAFEKESIENISEDEELLRFDYLSIDSFFYFFYTEDEKAKTNTESLHVIFDGIEDKNEVRLQLNMERIFPEDIDRLFGFEKRVHVSIENVAYGKENTPHIQLNCVFKSEPVYGDAVATRLFYRKKFEKYNVQFISENLLDNTLTLRIRHDAFLSFLHSYQEEQVPYPLSSISLSKQNDEFVHLVLKSANEGVDLFASLYFKHFLENTFFIKKEIIHKPLVQSEEKKEKGQSVGKIVDGKTTTLFYKTEEGKMAKEEGVQK